MNPGDIAGERRRSRAGRHGWPYRRSRKPGGVVPLRTVSVSSGARRLRTGSRSSADSHMTRPSPFYPLWTCPQMRPSTENGQVVSVCEDCRCNTLYQSITHCVLSLPLPRSPYFLLTRRKQWRFPKIICLDRTGGMRININN